MVYQTTYANYEDDYWMALSLLRKLWPGDNEFPEGDDKEENDKTRADKLNNTWCEGLTIEEWARRAAGLE